MNTLHSRVQKFGNICHDFRVAYEKNDYHWYQFFVNATQTMKQSDFFLCCAVNVDKKYSQEVRNNEEMLFKNLDPLTGLYNHDAFMKELRLRLQEDEGEDYAVVSIDIEHFLLFNDWYGNEEGDKLLLYVATKIQELCTSNHGIAGRIGGDDFAMLLPLASAGEDTIGNLMITWMQDYDVNVKFLPAAGIYVIDDKTISANQMCDFAAIAQQSIKGNYNLRAATYNASMKQRLSNEQEVLFDVKNGLDHHEFVVYFQQQCSARTKRIIGAEALVRWNHPIKGMIYPNDFIPLLERSGFISRLDYYVWEEVCRLLHHRISQNKQVVPISVNVSRMDIFQYHIADVFQAFIEKYDLDSRLIEIEITESAYTEDFDHLLTEIVKLREAGFTVLMDDFGSGYSSLNMLKDIEIDVLKIDMKFLEMHEGSTVKSMGILESVIQMGKWMGFRMIAEGVETKVQVDNLLNLDCEYMQGYYFYKPMPMEQFEEKLSDEKQVDSRGILADRMPSICLEDLFHKDITSEGMLSNILGGIAIYEIHDDKHIVLKSVNDNYYRMTGCNSVDLKERCEHIIHQVHAEDVEKFWNIFHQAEQASSLGASGTFRRYRLNGELMWMHLHAFYIRKQGNVKVFYGSITDYSEIMNLQEDRIRLLEAIPGDLIEYRIKDDRITSFKVISVGLANAHGYNESEYRKDMYNPQNINRIAETDRQRVIEIMKHPSTWHDHEVIDYQIHRKDGTLAWQEQHLTFVARENEEEVYIQMCTDITKRKQ